MKTSILMKKYSSNVQLITDYNLLMATECSTYYNVLKYSTKWG